jgi:predicted nucleotidyltransferase
MDLNLSSLERLPEHKRLLIGVRERFATDDRVIGVLLGGSLALDRADRFSDVDLYVFVRDEDFESVFAKREAIAWDLGPVIVRYLGDHMPGGRYQLIIWYAGQVHLDLMFRKSSEAAPHWKWKEAVILKDSIGTLARLKKESRELGPATVNWEQVNNLNQKFWGWVAYTAAKILRGELWEAFDNIGWIRNEALLVMLAWAQDAQYEGHRRLESKLDQNLLRLFNQTVCSLNSKSVWSALMVEVQIFRELRSRLSAKLGAGFDEQPEIQMMSELEGLWNMHGWGRE